MDIRLNKKAVLFSLISVLFSILFITLFSQNFNTMYEDRIPGSNIRIKVIDTYARNFEIYLEDSVRVSTYHTLNAITNYSYSQKKFFKDQNSFNKAFSDCMIYNLVNRSDPTTNCGIGQYYLDARLNAIKSLSSEQLNINTTFHINSIDITQRQAFEVEVRVNLSYNVTDNSDENYYAKWSKEIVIIEPISIIGLLEPTGNINDSSDKYNRTIRRYIGVCEFADIADNFTCWNSTNRRLFYQDRSFRLQKESTSFLQRYWNNNSPSSCCGIETMLHPSELVNPTKNQSFTERYYWNGTYTCNNGIPVTTYLLDGDNVSLDSRTAITFGFTLNDSTIISKCP